MSEKILLIDGYSILNRAYYGLPALTNSRHEPTGGIYGFMNIMYKMIDQELPQYIAVAFDVHEPTFRHRMYPDYKGTRKPMPDDLRAQVPVLKELLAASGIRVIECPGYEADDIIGTLSRSCAEKGIKVSILSGDRDLLQLVGENVTQFIPKTKNGTTTTEIYGPEELRALYGTDPKGFIDIKALMGDSSDNIPGVPGVGEKTAIALIGEYGSLENIRDHLDEIKPSRAQNAIREHFDMALMSRTLATIALDAPLDVEAGELRLGDMYTPGAYEIIGRLELKTLMKKFSESGMNAEAPSVKQTSIPDIVPVVCSGMDIGEIDAAFEEAAGRECAVCLVELAGEKRLALAVGTEKVYDIRLAWMTDEELLKAHIEALAGSGASIRTLDLAALLRTFDLKESEAYTDVSIGAYLLNPLKNSYRYEDIARDYLGTVFPAAEELFDKKTVPSDEDEKYRTYFSRQALTALLAWPRIEEQLSQAGMLGLFRDVEMPTAFRLHEMEKAGIRVNRDELASYSRRLGDEIERLERTIYELAGEDFNVNSPRQLGEILFEKLGLPGGKKTKSGYSTAADVLEKLRDSHPLIPAVLEYRTYTKLRSTYAEGLAEYIGDDERIHGHFLQTVTATGRISSADPNLQNIPVREELGREIRKLFIPAEGCIFVDADYSQIELRVLAHFSGDERLIAAYNSAEDIHAITASHVFHVPLAEVTRYQRSAAKAVNFGIVYGESAFGLAEGLGISRKEANSYIADYFATYPGVKQFLDRQVADAKNNGFVTTLFGRRRPVPELKSSNFMQRQFGERVAMNSPIQGTAADIMKMAMIAAEKALRERGLAARIVLQVHDELLIEAPLEEKEAVCALVRETMAGAASLRVPLEVSVESGESWYETK
ncbi:MAG: DNA polymerase I [Lachnospiraceae bacterium]|nr:DNA polymerase I [Lachnospiraceae bacterium]